VEERPGGKGVRGLTLSNRRILLVGQDATDRKVARPFLTAWDRSRRLGGPVHN
jgi:hypothetical protein